MARVDLGGKNSGRIWVRRPEGRPKDSLLLELSNTQPGLTPYSGRRLLFSQICFNCQSSCLVCSDQLGDLYQLDLARNKFCLVYRGGQAVTALGCSITRPTEALVGLADHTVRCIDLDTGELVATLRGHEASVKSLSIHSSGRYVLAVSSLDCVLWDLDTFSRCKTLNGGQDVGVQDVFFQPLNNVILTCFKDDSVHAWDSSSLEYLYHLPPPPLTPCILHTVTSPHYRAFATTQDGAVLVAGGRSSLLHVWNLSSQCLMRAIQLPGTVRVVKQLVFLAQSHDAGANQILGVLAQDGVLRWLDMESCRLLTQTGSHDQPLSHVCSSPDGHYLSAVSERGNILLYNVTSIVKKLDQSSVPVVKASYGKENEAHRSNQTQVVRAVEKRVSQKDRSKRGHRSLNRTRYARTDLKPYPPHTGEERNGEGKEGEVGGLDGRKMVSILKAYGEYPGKYRAFIWRSLLQLPGNHKAYSSLLERGTHPVYANLHRDYPIRSQRLTRVLQRALSVLTHWSPIFGETSYLPGLVFPFVKLFQNNQLVTFELLATLLINWCGNWFDYFPNPPLNLLAMVENCLAHHDPTLLQHLIAHNITSHLYAWPVMSTAFSEVLTRTQWLRLWDHAFSQPPGFLLLLTTALLTSSRSTLLHCTTHDDFQHFFRHPPSLDVGVVIQEAYRMQETTPPDIHPEKLLGSLVPLTKGTYPVFNRYPKFIVDYQAREREKIRQEEEDYLRQRQGALELERLRETRRAEEEAWFRQQQLLLEAEEQRRKTLSLEEERLTDQRTRLMAMKREMQVKELKVMDATRRDFLQHQRKVKEAQIRRLDDQIQKRVVQRDVETQAALEEIELKAVELERQRVHLQHQLARCQEEMLVQLDMEASADARLHSLHHSQLQRETDKEEEREKERLAGAQASLAANQVKLNCTEAMREMETMRREEEEGRRQQLTQVSTAASDNVNREREVEALSIRVEETQLTTQPEKGSVAQRQEKEDRKPLSSTDSPGLSALLWSRRRDRLDQQEAELLRRVQGVREKVVGHMTGHRDHMT